MEKYSRWFIISSVVYLLIGTLLGVMMAGNAIDPSFRYIHIHLNLFGFMAMMVFGVAYHILPRFMGKQVKWPKLIPLHFYAVNAGLIGMMLAYISGGYVAADSGVAYIIFQASGGFAFLGVLLFAVNLIPVMMVTKRTKAVAAPSAMVPPPAATQPKKGKEVTVSGDMKIGEILEKKPATLNIFINAGFKALADPEKRKMMGDKLVLKTACQIRGINLDELLSKLNGPISEEDIKTEPAAVSAPEVPAQQLSLKRGDMVELDTPVGHMIQVYPETKKVLEENYGGECFSCPGMAVETVKQTADMHSKDPQDILGQCNTIVKEVLGKS